MKLFFFLQSPAPFIATALLLTSLSYAPRSVTGLVIPVALITAVLYVAGKGIRGTLLTLASPFLPLVLVTLAVAPFQETISEALGLLAIAVVYALARLLRAVFPLSWLLFGVSFAGFFTGLVRQASLTPLVEIVPLLEKVAEIQGRNPAGTATAFASVALLVLASEISHPRGLRLFFDSWLLVTGFLMIVSDVMTGVIGSITAGVTLGIAALSLKNRNRATKFNVRVGYWLFILFAVVASAGVVALVNVIGRTDGASDVSTLRRDFFSVTGRREIWTCYFEVVNEGRPNAWLETLECTGYNHANLHSTYLQAHLLAGIPGLLAAGFAFLASIIIGLLLMIRAKNSADLMSGAASLGIGVLAAVFALTESYLFVYLYPTIVVFMFAPEMRFWPRKQRDSAFLRKKAA